jgi:hypothetical protein
MDTKTKDNVHQDYSRTGIFSFLQDTLMPHHRFQHGVGLAPRELVLAHIHARVANTVPCIRHWSGRAKACIRVDFTELLTQNHGSFNCESSS